MKPALGLCLRLALCGDLGIQSFLILVIRLVEFLLHIHRVRPSTLRQCISLVEQGVGVHGRQELLHIGHVAAHVDANLVLSSLQAYNSQIAI